MRGREFFPLFLHMCGSMAHKAFHQSTPNDGILSRNIATAVAVADAVAVPRSVAVAVAVPRSVAVAVAVAVAIAMAMAKIYL
jgi:hypothetical protein